MDERTDDRAAAVSKRHARALARAFEEGRQAYGALPLPYERFAREVAARTLRRLARAGAPASHADEALATVAGADLFLAIACDDGVPGAWEVLAERFVPRLRAVASRQGLPDAEAETLAREIPGALIAEPGHAGARTRLGTYEGRGSLLAWLAVILLRRVADRARSPEARAPRLGGEGGLPELRDRSAHGADPAVRAENDEAGRRLAASFRIAWAELTPREAAAVLFRYREGLPQKEIAGLLEVGEPRVSRILDRAVEKLGGALQGAVPGAPGAGIPDSLWGALREALSGSLATSPAPPDPGGRKAHGHAVR